MSGQVRTKGADLYVTYPSCFDNWEITGVQWRVERSGGVWTLQDPVTELFLGVDAHRTGARVIATPTATCWRIVLEESGGSPYTTTYRCVRHDNVVRELFLRRAARPPSRSR